jgi:hypothetical protein
MKLDLSGLIELDIPDFVASWLSMMTKRELFLLHWLAANYFKGEGIIVDAGVFLGGSTNAFATGLLRNTRKLRAGPVIQSYDIARWVSSMDKYLEIPAVKKIFCGTHIGAGDDFENILQNLLAQHRNLVDLRIGDIVETAHTEHFVELAFYDCLKDARRDLAVFNAFAPHYIPGHTLIIQQDYFYEGAAVHKIRQEFYSEYFQWVGRVDSTAVFQLQIPLPREAFMNDQIHDLSVDQRVSLLRQAARRADREKERLLVDLSLLEHLIEIKAKEAALIVATELEQQIGLADTSAVTRRPAQVFARLKRQMLTAFDDASGNL